jgi:putative membrane protein
MIQEYKTWDKQGLFHAVLLFSFHLFFLWMILSGNSIRYLSMRLFPFLYFAAAAFLLLTIVQIKKSRVHVHEPACECGHHHHTHNQSSLKKVISYVLLILPILLAVIVPYQVPGSALAAKKGVQIGITSNSPAVQAASIQSNDTDDDPYEQAANELKKKDKIVVNDDNYFKVLSVLDQYTDQFVGKKIQINGMVYTDPDSLAGKKEIGRVLIACCFADATFYGIPIINHDTKKIKQDTWISVEGTIEKMTVKGQTIACIKISKTKKISVPKNPYIYPNI